ncbi:MAG: aminotransferase class V-fold PLP-dependent enzyme [Paludibacteraceae bacterium]|nr:aminotransferase class V-fold PLP-dependent enzyme [Paludibacteraceae bacterium]
MIPLYKPYMPLLPQLESILASGNLTYGYYAKQFEEELKTYFTSPYVLITNTFSNAISVAITTLGLHAGDEIIMSPMGCLASTQPYAARGLRIRWADIDPERGTLSPESVKNRITKSTKVIVHNHFCGYPGYIEEINAIGRKYGIPVIDDGIECFGTEYRGRKIGNVGTDITVFSLSAVRLCNCIEGGILIFKDKEQYEKALLIRDCGINRDNFRDKMGEINPNCDITGIGFSALMSEINGYIGLRQMAEVDGLLEKHRKQAKKWDSQIACQKKYKAIQILNGKPNYWVYGLLTDNKIEAIRAYREKGYYASGVHLRNDYYSVFGRAEIELAGVEEFFNAFIALPCGWWMDE